jgi:hypothetical protein
MDGLSNGRVDVGDFYALLTNEQLEELLKSP